MLPGRPEAAVYVRIGRRIADVLGGSDCRPAFLVVGNERAARRVKRSRAPPRFHWPFSTLSTAFLALVVVDSALIAWRTELVRWAPQSASLYAAIGLPINLRGLAFNNVSVARETQDGVAVLVAIVALLLQILGAVG